MVAHNSEIKKRLKDMDAESTTKLWRSDMSSAGKKERTELIQKLDHDLRSFNLKIPTFPPPVADESKRSMPKVLHVDGLRHYM